MNHATIENNWLDIETTSTDMGLAFSAVPTLFFQGLFGPTAAPLVEDLNRRIELPPVRPEAQMLRLIERLWQDWLADNFYVMRCDAEPFHPDGLLAMVFGHTHPTPPLWRPVEFPLKGLRWESREACTWTAGVRVRVSTF